MYAFRALNPLARKQVTHQHRKGHCPIFGDAALTDGELCLAVHHEAMALLLAMPTGKEDNSHCY